MTPLHRLPHLAGLRWLSEQAGLGSGILPQRWRDNPKKLPAPHAWQGSASGRRIPLYRAELGELLLEDWFDREAPAPLDHPAPVLYNRTQLGQVVRFSGMHEYTHQRLATLPDVPEPAATLLVRDRCQPLWRADSQPQWRAMLARRHPQWARNQQVLVHT